MTALFEKFRPQILDEVVGQDAAVKTLRTLETQGRLSGRAYLFVGPSGSGKTTLGRIVARMIASDHSIIELDGDALTDRQLRDILRGLFMYGWGDKPGRAVIVNECHGLSASVVRALLVALEDIPAHVVWIFTTTNLGAGKLLDGTLDGSPLFSRCLPIELARRDVAAGIAERVRANMESIGMNGHPIEWYTRLVKDCRNNWREVYQRAESAALAGE